MGECSVVKEQGRADCFGWFPFEEMGVIFNVFCLYCNGLDTTQKENYYSFLVYYRLVSCLCPLFAAVLSGDSLFSILFLLFCFFLFFPFISTVRNPDRTNTSADHLEFSIAHIE